MGSKFLATLAHLFRRAIGDDDASITLQFLCTAFGGIFLLAMVLAAVFVTGVLDPGDLFLGVINLERLAVKLVAVQLLDELTRHVFRLQCDSGITSVASPVGLRKVDVMDLVCVGSGLEPDKILYLLEFGACGQTLDDNFAPLGLDEPGAIAVTSPALWYFGFSNCTVVRVGILHVVNLVLLVWIWIIRVGMRCWGDRRRMVYIIAVIWIPTSLRVFIRDDQRHRMRPVVC